MAKRDDGDMTTASGRIHVGIGGWNYEPWRGVFYPEGLPQAKELAYAASRLTSIEINSTFYGSQKPESFRKWAAGRRAGFIAGAPRPRHQGSLPENTKARAEPGPSLRLGQRFGTT